MILASHATLDGQCLREHEDLVIECSGFVMLIQWVDRCQEYRPVSDCVWFYKPQWNRTSANEIPVGIRKQRPRYSRVMMRFFEHHICMNRDCMPDDTFIKWMIPDRGGMDDQARPTKWLSKLLEMLFVPAMQPRFMQMLSLRIRIITRQ